MQKSLLIRGMEKFPEILLASKSPRRQELLTQCGYSFSYVDIDADEDFPENLEEAEVSEYLALHKSKEYTGAIGNKILVTADTIVCLQGEIINKPKDAKDAFQMLKKLSNNMHIVYTGVCLRNDTKQMIFSDKTEVYFNKLTDEEISFYIENYKPFDKAGSYGVQDWMGFIGVKKINGCFYNVMGFPTALFYKKLQEFIS